MNTIKTKQTIISVIALKSWYLAGLWRENSHWSSQRRRGKKGAAYSDSYRVLHLNHFKVALITGERWWLERYCCWCVITICCLLDTERLSLHLDQFFGDILVYSTLTSEVATYIQVDAKVDVIFLRFGNAEWCVTTSVIHNICLISEVATSIQFALV